MRNLKPLFTTGIPAAMVPPVLAATPRAAEPALPLAPLPERSPGSGDDGIPASADPRIAEVVRYWRRRRPFDTALPGRQHICPSHLSDVLRHIWLCDVQRAPLRFRYRLVGTSVVYTTGDDMTGHWLDEVHERFADSPAYADFVAAANTGAIVYYKGQPLFHLDKDHIGMERVVLPLARDGKTVDMLLGITLYGEPDGALQA